MNALIKKSPGIKPVFSTLLDRLDAAKAKDVLKILIEALKTSKINVLSKEEVATLITFARHFEDLECDHLLAPTQVPKPYLELLMDYPDSSSESSSESPSP